MGAFINERAKFWLADAQPSSLYCCTYEWTA